MGYKQFIYIYLYIKMYLMALILQENLLQLHKKLIIKN